MPAERVCKSCKRIYEGDECPNCQSKETTTNFKGKIIITNPEQSEIAKNLNIKQKGTYAVKLG
ncbi:MAG: transcription elongation factor subunit Spt4 [Nanoarchaeota archaeon]|nr:transcription elongation factor subunit Spt4 [Nanoarchaeota archaeon]